MEQDRETLVIEGRDGKIIINGVDMVPLYTLIDEWAQNVPGQNAHTILGALCFRVAEAVAMYDMRNDTTDYLDMAIAMITQPYHQIRNGKGTMQ